MYYSVPGVILAGLALIVGQFIIEAAYNVFFSPLRKIPGPLLAKITPRWIMFIDIAGKRTLTIDKLHQKYGSSVRIGPNEVSLSNVETVKELYGSQTAYMKAEWYKLVGLEPYGVFALNDKAAHAERRKMLNHVFTQSNMLESEPLIIRRVELLVERIQERANKPVDMLLLFRLYSFDIVGELFLGQDFQGLQSAASPAFLDDVDKLFITGGLRYSFPWLCHILFRLPIPSLQHFLGADGRLEGSATESFETYISLYGRDSGRKDLLTKMLIVKPETGESRLDDRGIIREITNLLFAGTDTTSTTLTYLFWELARNPSWQQKARNELRSLNPENGKSDTTLSWKQLQSLPVLDAVTNEGLRLHPAAPASLPRTVPAGGRVLDGNFLPEKTVVSMQCYTTQRLPDAWSDPNVFLPDRWLQDGKISSEAKELFMPFSKGTRGCLGIYLALMEMKLVTAALIQKFDVSLAPDTTEESMTMEDHFLVIPQGHKCNLIFTPAKQGGNGD